MPIPPGSTIGILGGGQLGRMTALAARPFGYRIHILDPDPICPAHFLADSTIAASWDDADAAARLAQSSDVVTLEIEQVSLASIDAAARYAPIRPGRHVLEIIQDRITQKSWLSRHGFPVGPYRACITADDLAASIHDFHHDLFLKAARGGYDGRAQARLKPAGPAEQSAQARLNPDDTTNLGAPSFREPKEWKEEAEELFLQFASRPTISEAALPLELELSVLVARNPSGSTAVYPPALNHHDNQILTWSVLPARLPDHISKQATDVAVAIADQIRLEGLLCIEFFLTTSGQLLVNEMAPRPHNSYHASERACITSQFEQHMRAVCDLPLGDTSIIRPTAIVNLLGDLWLGTANTATAPSFARALTIPETRLHLYEKHTPKPARKMGHLSATAPTADLAIQRVLAAKQLLTEE